MFENRGEKASPAKYQACAPLGDTLSGGMLARQGWGTQQRPPLTNKKTAWTMTHTLHGGKTPGLAVLGLGAISGYLTGTSAVHPFARNSASIQSSPRQYRDFNLKRFTFQRQRLWLPSKPSASIRTFSVSPKRIDTIASIQLPESTLSTPSPSEPPFTGPLNFSIAPRSSSSSIPSTISPFDVTSFNTDKLQSTWPSQPPSLQPPAQHSTLYHQDDFVLYPSPPLSARQQPPRHWTQRATLSSSSTPRTVAQPSSDLAFTYAHNPLRHSHQPQQPRVNHAFSGSPAQDPRVAKVISQSQGFSTSSSNNNQSSPSGVRPQSFYAASAPSNSPRSNRPPVPSFSNNSAENISCQNLNIQQPHRRIMSTSNIPQDFAELLDFPASLTAEDFVPSAGAMDFTSINDPSKMGNPVTVSPKDLMLDAAFPPSTSFTDISTPSFDSPGYFSQNTSPLFFADSDLAPGHEHWDSLFPNDTHSSTTLEKPTNYAQNLSNSISASTSSSSPALKGNSDSSPEESPRPGGRPSLRHSSVSGVKPRHREKPLPPIEYDPKDVTAAKRARNTEAARKSRARKLELQMHMEEKIAELEASLAESRKREAYWKSIAEARE
ncbi:hypothetical protein AJ78_02516 [Emergomyces pasteurianus Ep9510]|uniref:BZIP domain-containing protein n=1 Tax=Emergomyces pasteurianus Ep9510 TaxID=1447872 RepID=A0A1J9PND1_9EURO|nr:hypothetical protein AJ78_02516 [Emergomyces pasteurianus Ep9510]